MGEQVLGVEELRTSFRLLDGTIIHPVDGVSISVEESDIVGIVGESGCGKSMTALSIIGLVPPPGKISGGKILFKNKDLAKLSKKEMYSLRGNQIATVFQDPMTYLNPVQRVGKQIEEAILLHTHISRKEAQKRVLEILRQIGIPAPERVAYSYPFELSGGMRQRILIAIAVCCNPQLLIADEPTTALDVTVQAQILSLLKRLVSEKGISMVIITHDMGIVADICNKIYVMYAGEVVESGTAEDIYYNACHPYTKALLKSVLTVVERKERINTIQGFVPALAHLPEGCRFSTRCEHQCAECRKQQSLKRLGGIHEVRCWLGEKNSEACDEKTIGN